MTDYYSATVLKEGGVFVARCLELGVSSRGETFQDSLGNLKQDILGYLKDGGQTGLGIEDVHVSIMRTEVDL